MLDIFDMQCPVFEIASLQWITDIANSEATYNLVGTKLEQHCGYQGSFRSCLR